MINFAEKAVFLTTVIIGSTLYAQEQQVETAPASQVVIEEEATFVTPNGTETLVPPGSYDVEIVEVVQLRLVPVDGSEPVLLKAERTDHEEAIEEPVALWVDDESGPTRHLVLMLPNGAMTDATASASGVQTRGAIYQAVNRPSLQFALTEKLAVKAPQRLLSLSPASWRKITEIGTGIGVWSHNYDPTKVVIGLGRDRARTMTYNGSSGIDIYLRYHLLLYIANHFGAPRFMGLDKNKKMLRQVRNGKDVGLWILMEMTPNHYSPTTFGVLTAAQRPRDTHNPPTSWLSL